MEHSCSWLHPYPVGVSTLWRVQAGWAAAPYPDAGAADLSGEAEGALRTPVEKRAFKKSVEV